MAVALSLLIVLPGLASSHSYDDTRGTLSGGASLKVDVLNGDVLNNPDTTNVDESLSGSYFNSKLYVSNFAGDATKDPVIPRANNRVRITAVGGDTTPFAGRDGELKDVADSTNDTAAVPDGVEFEAQHDEAADNIECVVATVKNNRSGKRIKVSLNTTDNGNTGTTQSEGDQGTVVFEVVANGSEESGNGARICGEEAGERVTPTVLRPNDGAGPDDPTDGIQNDGEGIDGEPEDAKYGRMPAKHGDTLTITVDGIAGSVILTVDGEGPEFTEISPAHGAYLSSTTVKFRFVVTDEDSGIAHDGELDYSRGDLDARAFNSDNDNYTSNEPRSVEGTGAARDIDIWLNGSSPKGDQSASGSSAWPCARRHSGSLLLPGHGRHQREQWLQPLVPASQGPCRQLGAHRFRLEQERRQRLRAGH